MARNGSGTYTKVNTFTAGGTITAASHNQNWDDAASEITNSVAADGQTTMTGPLKAASGTATSPGITFGSDTNSGLYRIGSDNIGLALNGVKSVDFSTVGISITGTLSATGAVTVGGTLSVTGAVANADGTVAAPAVSFTSDPDSGLYRIGANNIGLALNGAKVADFSTAGLSIVGTLSSTGTIVVATGGLTVTAGGLTVTAGGLTVTAGGVSLPSGSVADAALAVKPALVLIQTQAASSSGQIDFTTGLDDTYDGFEIVISNAKPQTDDVQFQMLIGTGVGPTYQSSNYAWSFSGQSTSSLASDGSGSDSKIGLSFAAGSTAAVGNSSGENYNATIKFNNPESTDFMEISATGAYSRSDNARSSVLAGGRYSGGGPVTGIRFRFSSGNIVSGRFSLYGYRKT